MNFGRQRRARVAITTAVLTLSAMLTLSPVPPLVSNGSAAADGPTFVKTLVGPSVAAMYPSGFEWDAVNDRIVVADTGLDRIDVWQSKNLNVRSPKRTPRFF